MKFSEFIIGTMRWGTWGAGMKVKEATQMIEQCIALNQTSFDLADIYGGYTTEALIGKAIKESKITREQIQIITKCGIQIPGHSNDYKVKAYDLSKPYILKQVEQSLRNIQTNYLDLLLIHRPSPLMNHFEIAEAFQELKESRKVLNFGVSNFTTQDYDALNNLFPLTTNQIEFSLIQNNALYDNTLQHALINKYRPTVWSPLGGYFGLKNERKNRIEAILRKLIGKYDCSLSELLLAWIFKHPSKPISILGSSKMDNIEQVISASKIEMDNEDWFLMLEASNGKEAP